MKLIWTHFYEVPFSREVKDGAERKTERAGKIIKDINSVVKFNEK